MVLDFNYAITDMDGKEYRENDKVLKARDFIPNLALLQKKEDPIKSYELALKIHKEGQVEVDTSDYDHIYSAVKDAQSMHTAVKAQILIKMKTDKEKQEKKT